MRLTLSVLPHHLAIARLAPSTHVPIWALDSSFFSISKTTDELSIVCTEERIPQDIQSEKGWAALKVEGPLDFSLTGILSSLAAPLAKAKVSIFAISTFDTDYILVKRANLKKAVDVLSTFCKINL